MIYKKYLLLGATLTLLTASCKKEENPILELVVRYQDQPVSGYNVFVSEISQVPPSDASGKISLPVTKGKKYIITLGYGNQLSSVHLGNANAHYIQEGVFGSQTEINMSAKQASAVVGGPRYKDLNADGQIDGYDLTLEVEITQSGKTQQEVVLVKK